MDGCVPVIHISNYLELYMASVMSNSNLAAKPSIALGGIVPNLLRKPKAMSHQDILEALGRVRDAFVNKQLHVFGIGGTATAHIAALLGIDSADSSGWRNRAARGIVQLPGSGDRSVANLGSWRGRAPSTEEWERLAACCCPGCKVNGLAGLQTGGSAGFCNRATHNLWTLLEETAAIETHLADNSYLEWYATHLDNTIYLPLIRNLVATRFGTEEPMWVDPVA
jgi:queuine/archaeosine tRNA-ribosyltransferase